MIIENRLALETYEQARCHSAEFSECQVKLQKEKGIFSVVAKTCRVRVEKLLSD
jgi:hypothetical protein